MWTMLFMLMVVQARGVEEAAGEDVREAVVEEEAL